RHIVEPLERLVVRGRSRNEVEAELVSATGFVAQCLRERDRRSREGRTEDMNGQRDCVLLEVCVVLLHLDGALEGAALDTPARCFGHQQHDEERGRAIARARWRWEGMDSVDDER